MLLYCNEKNVSAERYTVQKLMIVFPVKSWNERFTLFNERVC